MYRYVTKKNWAISDLGPKLSGVPHGPSDMVHRSFEKIDLLDQKSIRTNVLVMIKNSFE